MAHNVRLPLFMFQVLLVSLSLMSSSNTVVAGARYLLETDDQKQELPSKMPELPKMAEMEAKVAEEKKHEINNAILVQARNLLEETSPEIPDELPKPELPEVELPTLPGFPSLPEIFKSIFPTFPNKEIPEPNKLTSSQSTTSTTP
ncbi:hypothetical protein COLO4_32373 [Corchorus olitorius]|uniref:Uncharacterized protein n=1 Tax=Corchorus olitorius TaxID=93759 RepID=A0A1R3GZU5_9ROSI|nr:hypothetical protein COLO4_32373 [Corchorus olitorius]